MHNVFICMPTIATLFSNKHFIGIKMVYYNIRLYISDVCSCLLIPLLVLTYLYETMQIKIRKRIDSYMKDEGKTQGMSRFTVFVDQNELVMYGMKDG